GKIVFDPSTSARLISFKAAIDGFVQRPVFGWGVTGFGFMDAQYARVLAETGLVGFAAVVWLIWAVWRHARAVLDTRGEAAVSGRHGSALVAAQVVTKAINLLVAVALVRWLGVHELGRYAYVLAFCFPFGALADFGLATLAIRDASRAPAHASRVIAVTRR